VVSPPCAPCGGWDHGALAGVWRCQGIV